MNELQYLLRWIVTFSVIVAYVLKKILKLNIRNIMTIFLVVFLYIIIPSLDTINVGYFQLFVCIIAKIFIFFILLLKIPWQLKLILTVSLIIIYHKTFFLVYGIIFIFMKKLSLPNNDTLLTIEIPNLFRKIGIRILTNWDKLPSHPTMIFANYCRDRMENIFCIIIPRKLSVIMQSGFKKVNMNKLIENPIYVNGSKNGNFDYIYEQVKLSVKNGNTIFTYTNSSPSYYNYVGKLKPGMFKIAIKQGLSITPIAIDHFDTKGGAIFSQNFCMKVGETIYDNDLATAKYKVGKFLRETLKEFNDNKYNKDYQV